MLVNISNQSLARSYVVLDQRGCAVGSKDDAIMHFHRHANRHNLSPVSCTESEMSNRVKLKRIGGLLKKPQWFMAS